MQDRCITLNGNVIEYGVGAWMEGGKIIINGNVKSEKGGIGEVMDGGEIHINGDIIGSSDYSERIREAVMKGRVYIKGKLIVDK